MVKRRWLHEPALGRASLAEWGPLGAGDTGEVCLTTAGRAVAQAWGTWAGARLLLLGANVNDLAQAVPVATLAPGTLHRRGAQGGGGGGGFRGGGGHRGGGGGGGGGGPGAPPPRGPAPPPGP